MARLEQRCAKLKEECQCTGVRECLGGGWGGVKRLRALPLAARIVLGFTRRLLKNSHDLAWNGSSPHLPWNQGHFLAPACAKHRGHFVGMRVWRNSS